MPIFQLPGSNAFSTARAVKEKMQELRADPGWPQDIEYDIVFDPTEFIQASVNAVVETLFEAILLVFVVVLVFLQNWRAALIPMLAVPVSLIGTLAVMFALGYSINNLTLFGMVLAIGIVVDDAIVVVEAVEYHIARGLVPEGRHRARRCPRWRRRSSACRSCSAPCSCRPRSSPGLTGQFFKQFAVTIAVSTLHLGVQLADPQPGPLPAPVAGPPRASATSSTRRCTTCSGGGSSAASTGRSTAAPGSTARPSGG